MSVEDFAVVVGINEYRHLRHLAGAENDARDFVTWLEKPEGGAVPRGNISSIFASELGGGTGRPYVGEVDDRFEAVYQGLQDPAAGRTGRRLYIFLAGHGFDPTGRDAALLCPTASPERVADHIAGHLYLLWFMRAALFQEIVLIMDCCRDDYRNAPLRPPPWAPVHRPPTVMKQCTAFATKWGFRARERPDVDQRNRTRGVFSKACIDILNAGRVTGEEFKRFTLNRLGELMGTSPYPEPDIQVSEGLIFSAAANPPSGSLIMEASASRRGHLFRLNGPEGDVKGNQRMDMVPWQVPDLPFGQYALTDQDTDEIKFLHVLQEEQHVEF
jgi:hypothetical protein